MVSCCYKFVNLTWQGTFQKSKHHCKTTTVRPRQRHFNARSISFEADIGLLASVTSATDILCGWMGGVRSWRRAFCSSLCHGGGGLRVDDVLPFHLHTISAGEMALLTIDSWPQDWTACLSLFLETDGFAYLFFRFPGPSIAALPALLNPTNTSPLASSPAFDCEADTMLPLSFLDLVLLARDANDCDN